MNIYTRVCVCVCIILIMSIKYLKNALIDKVKMLMCILRDIKYQDNVHLLH